MFDLELLGADKELMQDYLANARTDYRENLVKLIERIDPREKGKGENSWPYVMFNRVLSDEQVEFLLNLELRVPTYIGELAEKSGKTIEEAAKLADDIAHIGIIEYVPDDDGVDRVRLPVFVVGSFENICSDKWRFDQYLEEGVAFKNYCVDRAVNFGHYFPISNSGVHRVVPVETAIENESRRMGWEEINTLIKDSGDSYAVIECVCRKLSDKSGESAGEPNFEWCLTIGHYADYLIRTGKGRKLTKEEFMDILHKSEEKGFVHNVSNAYGPSPIEYICNCDYKTCITTKVAAYTQNPGLCRSNFVAEVDSEKCVACGGCQEVCPMNAAKLGQKLPQKNPVTIPPTPIPQNYLEWGAERHRPNYINERKNVQPETGTSPCKTDCPAHISV